MSTEQVSYPYLTDRGVWHALERAQEGSVIAAVALAAAGGFADDLGWSRDHCVVAIEAMNEAAENARHAENEHA